MSILEERFGYHPQRVTRGNRRKQGITDGYKGLQGVKKDYKRLEGFQRYTRGYRGLQGVDEVGVFLYQLTFPSENPFSRASFCT